MIKCPVCNQKLMLTSTMLVGSMVVCPTCAANLRVTERAPERVEVVPESETMNANSKPESYA